MPQTSAHFDSAMDESIPISALQHYSFCPRQCAYIYIEQRWQDNYLTAKGSQLHERVHSNEAETRGNLRTERGVRVQSEKLGIHGQLDLLEIQRSPCRLTPVEYKKGQPKVADWDRIQLCAQALCLEEMRTVRIDRAALWYWKPRKREWVRLDDALRTATRDVIQQTRTLIQHQALPPAQWSKSCKACSFVDECMPRSRDHSARYIADLFTS